MYINNNSLFENRCKFCLYREGHECLKSNWVIPPHDFCVSFRYQSGLTKTSISSEDNKSIDVSPHSMWGDIFLSAPQRKISGDSSPFLDIAVTKKSQFFYNMIPLKLFYCSNCDLYFENSEFCPECENDLQEMVITLPEIEHLIFDYIHDNGLLASQDIPHLIRTIQYLTLSDINIMED